MANIFFGDDGFGADLKAFDFGFLNEYPSYAYRFSGITAYQDDKNFSAFTGDKIIYRGTDGGILLDPTAQGKPIDAVIGGTIKSFHIVQDGISIINVSGLQISAKALYDAVTADDNEAIKDLLLSGNDTINGTRYDDRLEGRGGDDVLKGEAANDVLYGGIGADDLYGGTGKDVFKFKALGDSKVAASGCDTIFDFSTMQDKIHLGAIDANTKLAGNQAFSFIDTKDFSGKAGELRYVEKASDTYIYGDVNGDGKADFAIHLDDAVSLHKGDFIL